MAQGTVKWFDAGQGFGYITMDDGSDIIVRWDGIQDSRPMEKNRRVEFEVIQGTHGPYAHQVRIVG